jgi:hypothetical protein
MVQWNRGLTVHRMAPQLPEINLVSGCLTNSDLELAGVVLHYCVLESAVGDLMLHSRAGIFCDNTPAVYWTDRMADKSQSATSGRLLRGLAMRQRYNQSGQTNVAHVAGDANPMADVASRIFNTEFADFDDSQFALHFQTRIPLPQTQSWTVVTPPAEMTSAVITTLLGKRLPMQHWTMTTALPSGEIGPPIQPAADKIRGCATQIPPSSKLRSSSSPLGSGQVTTVDTNKSTLAAWKKRSASAPKPQLAVPVSTVRNIFEHHSAVGTPRETAREPS